MTLQLEGSHSYFAGIVVLGAGTTNFTQSVATDEPFHRGQVAGVRKWTQL
jgi:hypothetical protein